MSVITCQLCATFFTLTIATMVSHLMRVHINDPNINIKCEVPGCEKTFIKINSYKSHLQRKHKDVDLKSAHSSCEIQNINDDIAEEVQEEPMDFDNGEEANNYVYDELTLEDRIERERRMNALYLLKTKECNLLTQKAADDIVEGSTWLVRNTIEMIQQGLQNRLDSAGIAFEAVPGLSELFDENHPISNPFGEIKTKHKQRVYFKQAFGLVEPRRVILGHSSTRRRMGRQYREVIKEEEMIYIPLLETLEKMLNEDSIMQEIQTGHKHDDGLIEDFCDSSIFSTHPLFSRDPTALQLMLYYDEVEVTNPLGTKTGKHKLGIVYFTLGNISPKHRSQLNSIQLLAMATNPIIKKYGICALLEPFMEDLEKLEQDGGHQFYVNETPMSFAGSIAFVSGDNLGSQLVGGFKEGPGAFLKCRHCMGNENDIKQRFCETLFTLRTRAGHNRQCDRIIENPNLSKSYGICQKSILCDSRYFHVINGLPGDAMHDILEGILQYNCKEMLKEFIYQDKYLNLDLLNSRLKKFDYGYYNDKNKPSPITDRTMKNDANSLKQKAAQMWCLGKHLPFLIGSCIPEEDERWQHFLTLLEIIDLVFAPVTSINSIGILEGLIEEYLWEFTTLYPGRSVIPKMHYLVHYPSHMYNFGPMVRTWCMRYEAKHRYFKKIAMNMGNFTNVPLTLANRHQMQNCYFMSSSEEDSKMKFLYKSNVIGHGKQVVAGDAEYFLALNQPQRVVNETDLLYESKSVSVHGTEYRVGAIILNGFENDKPCFASIEKIVTTANHNIVFVVKKHETKTFCKHFHGFEVERHPATPLTTISQSDLGTYLPAHISKPLGVVDGTRYVSPRFQVPML